jgi:hypothetical protein
MQHVFFKCTYDIIEMPGFFKKLKSFIGEFRIEQQPIQDIETGVVTISFSTDLVQIEEGKTRQVELIAENNQHGWGFTGISKCY